MCMLKMLWKNFTPKMKFAIIGAKGLPIRKNKNEM